MVSTRPWLTLLEQLGTPKSLRARLTTSSLPCTGFILILAMMLLSLPVLYCVSMGKGRRDAEAYQAELGAGRSGTAAVEVEDEDM